MCKCMVLSKRYNQLVSIATEITKETFSLINISVPIKGKINCSVGVSLACWYFKWLLHLFNLMPLSVDIDAEFTLIQHSLFGSWWVLQDNWGEESGMSLILGNALICWFTWSQLGCVTFWRVNLRCSEVKQLSLECCAIQVVGIKSHVPQ